MRKMARKWLNPGEPRHLLLSDRELEVFIHLASGKENAQIAAITGLSEKTVSTYKVRIVDKTLLYNSTQMAHYALHHKLIRNNCEGEPLATPNIAPAGSRLSNPAPST